jgi:hypothetical protein
MDDDTARNERAFDATGSVGDPRYLIYNIERLDAGATFGDNLGRKCAPRAP